MKIIGLTGGIASGKSTVTAFLRARGFEVVDADKIAWSLTEPHKALWTAYQKRYGQRVLNADNSLNRQAVADIVFRNPAEKAWMDNMAHPIIQREIEKRLRQLANRGISVVFLDVPLLYEVGWNKLVHEVWVIYVNKEQQLARLCQRNGFSEDEAQRRIAVQMSMDEKKRLADKVIDNNGSLADLKKQAADLLAAL